MISLEEYLASALRGALRNGIDSELLVKRLAQGARQRIQEEKDEQFRIVFEAEMRNVPRSHAYKAREIIDRNREREYQERHENDERIEY